MCIYTIVHLDTVFNAKNKIGIYLICYYIYNIYLSFLHVIWNLVFICPFESYCRYYLKNINNRCQKRHIAQSSFEPVSLFHYVQKQVYRMKVKPLFITRVNIMSSKYLVVQEFAFCLYSKQEFVKLYLIRAGETL